MADQVSFAIPLNQPETLSYSIPLSHPLANVESVGPYATDFIFYYKNKPLFGGMHTEVDVDDVDNESLQIAGKGWLHYFERRFWPPTNDDGTEHDRYLVLARDTVRIFEDLYDTVSALDGLPIQHNNPSSGQTIDYFIDLGDTETIFAKGDALAKTLPGFDYEITWDKQLKIYVPKIGSTRSYVLQQGSNCLAPHYTNQGLGGNYLWATASGSGGGRASEFRRDNNSIAKARRIDVTQDFGQISDPDALSILADGAAPRESMPIKQISITWVGDTDIDNIFDEIWRGDTVRVIGDTGYEYIDAYMRVVNIEGNPTDEGDESITFTFDDGTLSL